MKPPPLALLFLALVPAAMAGPEATFVRVWPGWRDGSSFKRISEYFDGVENTSGEIMLRSVPAKREGYYFLARVSRTGPILEGAKFVLQVILPTDPEPKRFTFDAYIPSGSHVFELGLTGADWPGKKTKPVAWKLDLAAPDGTTIASQQSYLWSK